MSARVERHAVRRGARWLACVLLSWLFAVTVLVALSRILPVAAGDAPDHLE